MDRPFNLPPPLKATVAALAPVACSDEVSELGAVDEIVVRVELFLGSLSPLALTGSLVGLVALELSPMAFPRNLGRRFSQLSPDKRREHFARFWDSEALHPLALALKAVIANGYYDIPRVRAHLDYHPERWIAKVASRRLLRYAKELQKHEKTIREPSPLAARALKKEVA